MQTDHIIKEVNKVIIGKQDQVEKIMMAILAKGHVLLEDMPGVGKTTLAKAFSQAMGLENKRIQFTPDVLPSDIVGFNAFDNKGNIVLHQGAAFTNLFLADEINRTSSRTQSALLEVMEENQITVDGVTYPVSEPFLVIATQNPFGSAGTQLLPESQIDRFMIALSLGYPDNDSEIEMLKRKQHPSEYEVKNVCTKEYLIQMQNETEQVFVHDDIMKYAVSLVHATRVHESITLGASPRGVLCLINMAKACAYMNHRNYVIPEDVKHNYFEVLMHRIQLEGKMNRDLEIKRKLLMEILNSVKEPALYK